MELQQIALSALDRSLSRLRLLPERAIQRMEASLHNKGQLTPLVAARHEGSLMLVDGFVRHLAAQRLGLESVLVEVVELSPVQMKAQVYLRNQERGMGFVQECLLVRELVDSDGLQQVEVADLLERHKSWVSRRLTLLRQLSPHLLAEAGVGLLPGGSLWRLAQLPARNQEALWASAAGAGLSPRETDRLVQLWQRAREPPARRYVLEHPRDALERASGAKRRGGGDPRLPAAAQRAVAGLMAMQQMSLRLTALLSGGLGELPPEGLRALREAHQSTQQQVQQALDAVHSWLHDTEENTP